MLIRWLGVLNQQEWEIFYRADRLRRMVLHIEVGAGDPSSIKVL